MKRKVKNVILKGITLGAFITALIFGTADDTSVCLVLAVEAICWGWIVLFGYINGLM